MNKIMFIFMCILGLFVALLGTSLTSSHIHAMPQSTRMYVDEDETCRGINTNLFHIHKGHNEWIAATRVVQDQSGMYVETENIVLDYNLEYQKHWKCPYCFLMWPEGVACQNPKCPSKYR